MRSMLRSITSVDDLEKLREEILQERKSNRQSGQIQVIVGMGSPAIASGARQTLKAILDFVEKNKLANVRVSQTGNSGLDSFEPVVQIVSGEGLRIGYGKVTPEIARKIMREHVMQGKIVAQYRIDL